MNNILRVVLLLSTDREWVNQLHEMEDLREGVGLQAYGQRDPLVEYTKIGFEIFQGHMQSIEENVLQYVCRLDLKPQSRPAPSEQVVRSPASRPLRLSGGSLEAQSTPKGPKDAAKPNAPPPKAPIRVGKKVGRNDPCPCGSGKKYKDCCGKLA